MATPSDHQRGRSDRQGKKPRNEPRHLVDFALKDQHSVGRHGKGRATPGQRRPLRLKTGILPHVERRARRARHQRTGNASSTSEAVAMITRTAAMIQGTRVRGKGMDRLMALHPVPAQHAGRSCEHRQGREKHPEDLACSRNSEVGHQLHDGHSGSQERQCGSNLREKGPLVGQREPLVWFPIPLSGHVHYPPASEKVHAALGAQCRWPRPARARRATQTRRRRG